jgi:hypothetical protein
MVDIENIFQLIEMKLDSIEDYVDELEDAGESVDGIRNTIAKLWNEIDEIS